MSHYTSEDEAFLFEPDEENPAPVRPYNEDSVQEDFNDDS